VEEGDREKRFVGERRSRPVSLVLLGVFLVFRWLLGFSRRALMSGVFSLVRGPGNHLALFVCASSHSSRYL